MIDLDNFTSAVFNDFDINMVQKEVDGGSVRIDQIDESISRYPEARSIVISGLNQDSFEYFIQKYGQQFEAISFWKNKLVGDLSCLGKLRNIKYIHYFFNQKSCSLWDMSENSALKGLSIYDFSKLKNINEIGSAKSLEFFGIGDKVWAGMEIESLKPIVNTNISHFEWYGKKVSDNDFKCLADSKIKILDINPTQFTVEELTDLLACFPDTLSGSITKPYVTGQVTNKGIVSVHYFLCKHKKACIAGKDDERFSKYLKDFEILLENKRKTQIK